MIQVISKTLDYKTGLTGSEVLTGTALKYGAYQGFICQTYTVVAIVTNSKGDDITDLLGLRGVTLSPGIYICVPKGESIYSISLASGSVVLYGIAANIERVPTIAEIIDAFSSRVTTDGGTLESTSCINGSLVPYYKDASFVLIPSGYKALKAYAQKPITGNGDLTWSRNSVANRTQSDGNIGSVAANVPRLSYMYGSCPALLLEPQRTNSLRNSTMQGASTSPSTLPTNWIATLAGLTQTIVGIGTENGLPYIDVQFSGTATATSSLLRFESATQIVASNGQTWASSFWIKEIAAPTPPNSYQNYIQERDSGGAILTTGTQTITISSTLTRNIFTRTNTNASTARINNAVGGALTIGNTYDFTIRIAAPQLELGAFATTWINTTNAAATRLVDTFTRNNIYTNGLISASGGTWFVELRDNIDLIRNASAGGIFINTGTLSLDGNGFLLRNPTSSSQKISIIKYIAGVASTLYNTITTELKVAIKWNGTTADVFVNGTKVVSATAFTTTTMENLIGEGTNRSLNIQQMALYPTPLSDATCIAMTQ